jgi:hypothetical protein
VDDIITEEGTVVAVEVDAIVMVAATHTEVVAALMVVEAMVAKDSNITILLRLNLMVHISQEMNGTSYHNKSAMK